ncbi:hypothetical protein K493DRAFT_304134 [Basidiobolus meristosporus CBS 931.73]|uniref:SWIRM domain-containing protein n=1 Tax=Basidiobolus meristosporus CBS 931.73 TaxID=1314790 RepID=A0A1Y1XZZ9_9FUNG|nr:hypothetical protein K493DRAFT_304134 [Basidiobolus meristosporus CBS 931.73]|eukprot:ORX91332.1 hypothetical protein K493DRAFT_304134 [Basidiobolus meristosporus CBS 931.73]
MYRENPQRLLELGGFSGAPSLKHRMDLEYAGRHASNKESTQPTGDQRIISPPINRSVAAKCKVHWKGTPLDISRHPLYDALLPEEAEVASTLRLKPDQYLTIKRVILQEFRLKTQFRKTDAQRMCRVDVNKTGKIWDWFLDIGWLSDQHPHPHPPSSETNS